jgi:site-specific recombinase XerD
MLAMWFSVAALSIFALLGWLFAWHNNKQLKALREQMQQLEKKLRSELAIVNSGAIGMGQRLIAAEKKINDLICAQDQHNSPESLPYTQAAKLIEQGADMRQLVDRCGLSEAEAQLMAMMQQSSGNGNH